MGPPLQVYIYYMSARNNVQTRLRPLASVILYVYTCNGVHILHVALVGSWV